MILISTNEKFVKKYFFFDIDGTLSTGFPDPFVPESTRRTLKKLEENGHFLAIATGRSHAKAVELLDELGFDNMVSDGGNGITINRELLHIEPLNKENCIALLREADSRNIPWGISIDNSKTRYTKNNDFVNRELLHIEPLNKENCIALLREADSRNIPWGISIDNSKTRYTKNNDFVNVTEDVYMTTIVDPDLDIEKIDTYYKLYIACKPEEDNTLEALKNLPFVRFHDAYLFVEPDDKSVGIKAVMDHFGAPYKDVVVFGDQKNDLKMFRDEWTSIAMGNAIDELKEKADFVTKDADKDGIEYACKHFGWID